MIKPLSAIATAITIFAAVTITATPAVADGSCSINLPAKVQIDRPYKLISATLGSDCANSGATWADWTVRHSYYGPDGLFIFDNTSSDSNGFYDWEHTGTYYVEPDGAYDANYTPISQNTRSYVVKYATWGYVASSRSGGAVYVNVLLHQWTSDGMASPGGRTVYLQRYLNGAWQTMLSRTTNSAGHFTVGFIQSKVYQYRVLATETGSAWGAYSGSTFR